MNVGTDYGLGQTNIDRETGIRFGVINMNTLNEWAWDSFEADYGDPHCPKCGNEAIDYDGEKHGEYEEYLHSCCDYACESCEILFDGEHAFGDEPLGWSLNENDLIATVDSQNDVFVIKSPYFTYAQFCSPCAPGAGHLENPMPADSGAPKTYCLDGSWFDDHIPPYDIYSVETGELLCKAGEKWPED